jgi:hypothetical protein
MTEHQNKLVAFVAQSVPAARLNQFRKYRQTQGKGHQCGACRLLGIGPIRQAPSLKHGEDRQLQRKEYFMADKFVMPKGRQTIRKSMQQVSTDPLNPTVQRENRRVRLWNFQAAPGTTLAKLEAAYLSALDTVDSIEERKANSAKSGKFTADGLTDDALQFALNNAVPTFKRGRDAIKAAKAEAKARREALQLQKPDKSDVAGAILRAQICDRLAAMSAKDRDAFINSNIEKLDPVTAEAILTAPAWLSGVSNSHRQLLTDRALQAQHGEAVAELQELERAIEVATSAVEIGRDEVRIEAGVHDPHKFDQLAAPIEAKQSAPWLRRKRNGDAEEIRVVDIDQGVERSATPEEIASGVFYENADEYRKGKVDISSTPTRSAA